MPIDPADLLDAVYDERSFLAFAQTLLADRLDALEKEKNTSANPFAPGANGWENGTIEDFLEAAISWAESTNTGLSQGLSERNPWKRFATFLYCGKIHE